MLIHFNRPYTTGQEFKYINEAISGGQLSGNGMFTKKCEAWLQERTGCKKALLTHSCTGALEIAAMLCRIEAGDEVIMPSYTFVSTANAFVLRGGVPVFVDIRPDTLNIDESKIEGAITDKTRAIVPVHYAGLSCEMDEILSIAHKYDLYVIEDAAQAIMSHYRGRAPGTLGHMGTLSFHETKNIHSGEGGGLLINDEGFIERAEIIREKGTDRSRFFRGEVDKYSWVDTGSSYPPSELAAAFLWAQMKQGEEITKKRIDIWNKYHSSFEDLEKEEKLRRPVVPSHCRHNAHMYYLLLPDLKVRNLFISYLKEKGIQAVFHYVPLHNSVAGKKYGRPEGDCPVTVRVSDCLVRLPLWAGMDKETDMVIEEVRAFFRNNKI